MTQPDTTKKIRILVVDDSAFMRKALTMMLESDPSIKVIGTARDGAEGVQKVRHLKPDLVTMDIEMPRMDGLTALKEIMAKHPVPVMMISSLTTDGARATLDALDMGAVDFIPKQLSFVSLDIVKIKDELLAKIKDIARRKSILMARLRLHSRASLKSPMSADQASEAPVVENKITPVAKRHHPISILAIGSSTGGPPALQAVIPKLPRNFPVGVMIAQHMPPTFTKSLAERLDSLSALHVKEAIGGDIVQAGTVLIAPGGKHMTVSKTGTRAIVSISDYPQDTLYKPCVDVMMNSVAEHFGNTAMGVILTGMGNNGVEGLSHIKTKGGIIIAQDEVSSVVYGMPRAAAEAGIVDHQVSIEQIVHEIISYF